ncbi:hypothetical protein PT974_08292 [Cladobotryum mycophilum]|uniref:Zn(2)-C6 fungal-type domain-containing protein n=1 Tax=Cladobotryum mycophilum TaxID=491253 RepID=A0ABR0SCZ5_9HYPO
MVGVPRSSGCQLCRKRRVKCDEGKPECGNCLKYGAQCPGYERAMKFVSGKHQIRSKGARKAREGDNGSGSCPSVVTTSGGSSPAVSLIMSQLFYPTSDSCFLSRPEWTPVLRDGGRHIFYPPDVPDQTITIMDGFFERLAELPEVLWWGYPIREAHLACRAVSPKRVEHAMQLASKCHKRFSRWYEGFKSLGVLATFVQVPSKDPDSMYEWVFDHKVPWLGSMLMSYWASMLILQELLTRCNWPEDFEESQRELVQNILRSVESVGQGVLGPYRVGYSLRIAYEFASSEAQQWIRAMLDRFSKSYAATDKTLYPSPRMDQKGYA